MSKPKGERYTIAVDFDGVIHSYTSPWVDAVTIPDPPVPGAIEWLMEMGRGFNVAIFTTRGKTEAGQIAVRDWLYRNGFRHTRDDAPMLVVTAEKPPALIYLDDRGWRFEGTFPTAEQIHKTRPWKVTDVD